MTNSVQDKHSDCSVIGWRYDSQPARTVSLLFIGLGASDVNLAKHLGIDMNRVQTGRNS